MFCLLLSRINVFIHYFSKVTGPLHATCITESLHVAKASLTSKFVSIVYGECHGHRGGVGDSFKVTGVQDHGRYK